MGLTSNLTPAAVGLGDATVSTASILADMKPIVLFEDAGYVNLLPLLFWRCVFELRAGRNILLDRTAQKLGRQIAGIWTRDWIAKVAQQRCGAPANRPLAEDAILVNGRWLVDGPVEFPSSPRCGTVGDEIAYIVCDRTLSARLAPADLLDAQRQQAALRNVTRVPAGGEMISYPWDLIDRLSELLIRDWQPRDSAIDVPFDTQTLTGPMDQLHIGERAQIHATAILDASAGPIYISDDVAIAPYAVVEGPAYLGPGTRINPYTWIHGGASIGPMCKLGGEIDACVIHGCTNKQHHGFLGHSYVGSWVNLGAGTSNSDLKNTYGTVRVLLNGVNIDTGQMFFGAVIADHVKTGINSAIPTGAVLGFAASAAACGLLPKYVPSFGWVTDRGVSAGKPDRLLDTASKVMARRHVDMTDDEVELFFDLAGRVATYEARGASPG